MTDQSPVSSFTFSVPWYEGEVRSRDHVERCQAEIMQSIQSILARNSNNSNGPLIHVPETQMQLTICCSLGTARTDGASPSPSPLPTSSADIPPEARCQCPNGGVQGTGAPGDSAVAPGRTGKDDALDQPGPAPELPGPAPELPGPAPDQPGPAVTLEALLEMNPFSPAKPQPSPTPDPPAAAPVQEGNDPPQAGSRRAAAIGPL